LWQSLINLIEKIWGDFWKYGMESWRVLSTFMKCGFDLLALIFVEWRRKRGARRSSFAYTQKERGNFTMALQWGYDIYVRGGSVVISYRNYVGASPCQ
jgi:hypothetical protein